MHSNQKKTAIKQDVLYNTVLPLPSEEIQRLFLPSVLNMSQSKPLW